MPKIKILLALLLNITIIVLLVSCNITFNDNKKEVDTDTTNDTVALTISNLVAEGTTNTAMVVFSKNIKFGSAGNTDGSGFTVHTISGNVNTPNIVTEASITANILTLTLQDILIVEHRIKISFSADAIYDTETIPNKLTPNIAVEFDITALTDISKSKISISGTFSYGTAKVYVQKGSALAATISPTWDGGETTNQLDEGNIEYSIAPTDPAGQAFASTGLEFDASSGVISGTAEATSSTTEYTITAIGKEKFAGTKTATFTIIITEEPLITGTFSYPSANMLAIKDVAITKHIEPKWDTGITGGQLNAGNIEYSIAPKNASGTAFNATGLKFINGVISEEPTSAVEETYLITAKGIGNFAGEITYELHIKIYESVTHALGYSAVAHGSAATSNPVFGSGSIPTNSSFTIASTRDSTSATQAPTLPTISGTTGSIDVTTATTAGTYKITVDVAGFASEVIADFYVTTTPTTISELESALETGIKYFGNTADYNYIQTGSITSMRGAISQDYKDKALITSTKSFIANFNGDISKWDTSEVTDMSWMFYSATTFNKDINTKVVTYINDEGANATYTAWNTSQVTNMSNMFNIAKSFNGDISNWNTSNVVNMEFMLSSAGVFNGDISNWNTSNVVNMEFMLSSAGVFNGDISNWNTSNVVNMSAMFNQAKSFNGDISNWNTSAVTDMSAMFNQAESFNGDISNWNTSAVTIMYGMFKHATAFIQNLDSWANKLHAELTKDDMFTGSGLEGKEPCWYSITDTNVC